MSVSRLELHLTVPVTSDLQKTKDSQNLRGWSREATRSNAETIPVPTPVFPSVPQRNQFHRMIRRTTYRSSELTASGHRESNHNLWRDLPKFHQEMRFDLRSE